MGREAFYVQIFLTYGRFSRIIVLDFFGQMQKYKILHNFLSQNMGFLLPKVLKNTALSTMVIQHIFNKS